jgi:hypothetical protein
MFATVGALLLPYWKMEHWKSKKKMGTALPSVSEVGHDSVLELTAEESK